MLAGETARPAMLTSLSTLFEFVVSNPMSWLPHSLTLISSECSAQSEILGRNADTSRQQTELRFPDKKQGFCFTVRTLEFVSVESQAR